MPGGDHHVHLQVIGAQAHALGTEKRHGTQVAFMQAVFPHHQLLGFVQLIFAVGQVHPHDMGGTEQPVGVLLQAKNTGAPVAAFVGAHALEHAHAIVQGVGQYVNPGIPPGHQFAIQPNNAVAIGK